MKKRASIQRVSPERLREMLHHRIPRGRYLTKEGRKWVAVDNSTGDAWTEEFSRKRQAIRWLLGELELGDRAKQWARISKAEELVAAALGQGIELDSTEADMILGYLEDHEYCLMTDGNGMTMRHDEQYRDNHRGDEPYTILDTIAFCQEMNEDLLRDASSPNERDEEYLAELRRDEQVLDALAARVIQAVDTREVC